MPSFLSKALRKIIFVPSRCRAQQRQEQAEDKTNRFDELNKGYKRKRQPYVKMSKPRRCSYNKETDYTGNPLEKVTLGEIITNQISPKGSLFTPMPVEMRGITLRQLRAVEANVIRRCAEEGWVSTKDDKTLLTPDKVSMYDINKYIIIPFTMESEASFVETLPSTAGTQSPKFCISHRWGEPFFDTMACIEQMVNDFEYNFDEETDRKGGGMTQDTPIWIFAFANANANKQQHGEILEDPRESGFAKAVEVANFRTLSILDKDGVVFSRIWCLFEWYLTWMKIEEKKEKGEMASDWNGLWAVYIALEHIYDEGGKDEELRQAVGIVPSGATSDWGVVSDTVARELNFPIECILEKALPTMIETANASNDADKRHILNFLSGNTDNLDGEPPEEHHNYAALNDAIRGAFASMFPSLQILSIEGGDRWQTVLTAMSKSIKMDMMMFDFEVGGWDHLSAERATELMSHLPPTIEGLVVRYAPYGSSFMDGIIEWVKKAKNLKYLLLGEICVGGIDGGRDAGVRLAAALASNNTIETLRLVRTDLMGSRNVNEWVRSLSIMTSLKDMVCDGMIECSKEVDESTLDNNSMWVFRDHKRQKIYWKDATFPDATMAEEDVQKIEEATRTKKVFIRCMHH